MTDAEAAKYLLMSRRNLLDLRSKGALPATGADEDAYREAYIRHLRAEKSGYRPRAERIDLDNERARLAREQADLYALRNAQSRGELIDVASAEAVFGAIVDTSRQAFLGLPSRLAPLLAGCHG